MYSFAQRSDTCVLDEPLYASYIKVTGHARPYVEQLFASQSTDAAAVVNEKLLGPREKKVLFAKHIGKHKLGCPASFFRKARHVILVRDPLGVIKSFSKVVEATQQEIGYTALLEIVSDLRAAGQPVVVVLSDQLVRQPEPMLRALCAALDLPWEPAMLHWPAGPKPFDGVWAPWWYATTHTSTGFDPPALGRDAKEAGVEVPEALRPLLGECWALYDLLRRHALQPLQDDSVPRAPSSHPTAGEAEAVTGSGTHATVHDSRNDNVLVGMRNGVTNTFELVWMPVARVSVLDSGFMLGDGVWEGLRVHQGVMAFLQDHLHRLYDGAKALDMDLGLSQRQLARMMYDTLDANGMAQGSGVHIRLMVSRGVKSTPHQNPRATVGLPTIAIVAKYKAPAPALKTSGISLFTAHTRRGAPDTQDPTWNSHSKLNCISACIHANKAGADEALMLDPLGFVATCNSTNLFIVSRQGEVLTATTKYLMPGITRRKVLELCARHGIPCRETDFSLTQVYSAEECFVTGSLPGLVPVREVDGRLVGTGQRGPVTARLQELYAALMDEYAAGGREASLPLL